MGSEQSYLLKSTFGSNATFYKVIEAVKHSLFPGYSSGIERVILLSGHYAKKISLLRSIFQTME
jgi:hypothetical protein